MSRRFCLSRIEFLDSGFLLATFIDPWGEDDPITKQIHDGTFDEGETLNYWTFFTAHASPGAVVIDVGAFVGLFSFVATALRSDIKAVAFEASAVTFGRLVNNIGWNGFDLRVVPVNLAASSKRDFITFPHAFGIFSMSPGESINSTQQPDHTQTSATIPLDLMLEPTGRLPDYLNSKAIPFGPLNAVAAIKIDVEGHELFVLEGSRKLLDKFRPPVICEALDAKAAASQYEFFDSMSYRGIPVKNERNIVFIPREKVDEMARAYREWQMAHGRTLTLRASRILTYAP